MREDLFRRIEESLSRIKIKTEGGRSRLDLLDFVDARVRMTVAQMETLAGILLNEDEASQAMQRRILEAMKLDKTDRTGAIALMEGLVEDLKKIGESHS